MVKKMKETTLIEMSIYVLSLVDIFAAYSHEREVLQQ
jgi:hypothetical protein